MKNPIFSYVSIGAVLVTLAGCASDQPTSTTTTTTEESTSVQPATTTTTEQSVVR